MNEFVAWALRQKAVVRILIFVSLTAIVVGLISKVLSGYPLLVIGTIAAAFFAAVFFPRKQKGRLGNGEDNEHS